MAKKAAEKKNPDKAKPPKRKTQASAKATPKARRSTPAPTPEAYRLAGEPTKFVKLEPSGRSRKVVARILEGEEARAFATELHPPKVIAIAGTADKVIRCDWDLAANGYICDIIPADDPRATL